MDRGPRCCRRWRWSRSPLVTFAGLLCGRPAGLLDAPDGRWPWHRLVWLPVFALTLAGLTRLFHRVETAAASGRKDRRPQVTPPGAA